MGTILIRNVPEDVHRAFKAHCATTGITIQQAAIDLFEKESGKGTVEKQDKNKDDKK